MQFIDSREGEYVLGFAAVEVDLNHQVGATSDDEGRGIVAPEGKRLVEASGCGNAHVVPSHPEKASIIAFVSPSG